MQAGEVTLLLRELRDGHGDAFERLVPLIYDELRRIARRQLRRGPRAATLDTTALVHEAYLKLAGGAALNVEDRNHLLAVSARAMRQVLVDLARARTADKRGGAMVQVTLEEDAASRNTQAELILAVDAALARLRRHSERLARVVECRYFAGFSDGETADALGISVRTAQREWLRARVWLRQELAPVSPS